MVSDIRALASKASFSLSAVRIPANQVANWMVKRALSVGSWNLNCGRVPTSFSTLVCNDRFG